MKIISQLILLINFQFEISFTQTQKYWAYLTFSFDKATIADWTLFTISLQDVDELKVDIEILRDGFLSRPSDFEGHESDPAIRVIIGCFRELCTIVWMLYVRDELSLALRHKATLLQHKVGTCL